MFNRFTIAAFVAVMIAGDCTLAPAQPATVKPYVWAEGKCQLQFPGMPKKDANTLTENAGATIYSLTMDKGFGVKVGDAGAKIYFDLLRDMLLKNLNSKLLVDKDVTGEGFGGRELSMVNDQGGMYRARALLAGDKIYTVVMIGAKEKVTSKEADVYFESFKLLK